MYTYTLDEIIHLTGIPKNKAVEVCCLLCGEGYLIYDETGGKYSLTKDRDLLARLRTVRKDLNDDSTAQEMCSKIEDIMTLGKPLALSEEGLGKSVKDIGIPGLNIIFGSSIPPNVKPPFTEGPAAGKSSGLPRGHCILVKGAPGTGKTTMGLQIAIHLANYRALFLTFEEDISQLCGNLEVYCKKEKKEGDSSEDKEQNVGWEKAAIEKVTRSITKIQTPSVWDDPESVLQELISILDKELPQLIVIDSISRLRDIGGETKSRLVLRRLIRTLKIRNITSILLGEDHGEPNAFEDYEVDGVIRLSWIGDQLSLRVDKMRGMRSYKGPHSAALLTVEDLKKNEHSIISEVYFKNKLGNPHLRTGFNVFPEIFVYNELPIKNMSGKDAVSTGTEVAVLTGTDGLDDLLGFTIDDMASKGFKQGEAVLIIGSAGAGKTLLGLNFMDKGYKEYDETQSEKREREKIGVWISFEGDKGILDAATAGFKHTETSKCNYPKLLEDENYFKFFNFPPLNLDLNKIIYTLESLRGRYGKIDRLVIDSITELERARSGGQPEVKTFLAGLIQYLRCRGITTVFISRSDTFFRSIDKIEEQVSSLVDLIICIRNFDMHNQIHKGIYIQKARGRAHNSKILRMTIDSEKGIGIEDSGWDVENLLAGDTSNIQGPGVFFKLFYENPAEKKINDEIIEDFGKKRYPQGVGPLFGAARKASIHTEFWSFKGQYGPGHANTRVLCISDHVISAFRDNEKLTELIGYVKSELLQNIQKDKHLSRVFNPQKDPNKPGKFLIDAIPSYRDYGVMVLQNRNKSRKADFLRDCASIPKEMKEDKYTSDAIWLGTENEKSASGYTWDNLLNWIKNLGIKRMRGKGIIPFAFPPMDNKSEFIAFFMELLWSHGGDIYDIPIGMEDYKETGYRKKFRDIIKKRIIYDLKICVEYLNTLVKKDDQISNDVSNTFLKKSPADMQESPIYKEIEKRFKEYGIDPGKVGFNEIMNWTIEKIAKEFDGNGLKVIRCDDDSFKETLKLIMRLIHEAGVPNPIKGDVRDRAILSRHWYSQLYEINPRRRQLMPLPLAKIKVSKKGNNFYYYRSVTCATYWSLVMLKNALSPEIGGNFIESLNSSEYYKKRLKMRAGMPTMNWELEKDEFTEYDPDSYSIMQRIVDNGIKSEKLNMEIYSRIKENQCQEVDTTLKTNDYAFVGNFKFEGVGAEKQIFDYLMGNEKKDEINKHMFFPKYRQTRIAFYHIEQALYYQLRQMLMSDHQKEEDAVLKGIYGEIENVCNMPETNAEEEKAKEAEWDKVLNRIINELRLHLVLELLMYFFQEDKSKGM